MKNDEPKVYKCKHCNGQGWTTRHTKRNEIIIQGQKHYVQGPTRDDICNHCHGKGELDWIENIVGVNIAEYDKNFDLWYAPAGFKKGKLNVIAGGSSVKHPEGGSEHTITMKVKKSR